jgi:BASS family bile acid:Na+ symporter
MMWATRLLRNISFILALALALGLAVPQVAAYTKPAVTPVLGVVMTMSMLGVAASALAGFRRVVGPATLSVFLNYIVLSGLMVGLATVLLDDRALWAGFVLVAAVPPAVAVIPFSHRLGGQTEFALVGSLACYIAAFVATPVISVAFLGANYIPPSRLLLALGELIVAPFLVSRLLRRFSVSAFLEKHRGLIVNWGFFVVVYTIIGLNRDAFLREQSVLLPMCAVAFACTFAIAVATERAGFLLGIPREKRTSMMVMSAWKNYGLAGAIALAFVETRASIPAAVITAFAIANFVWLGFWTRKMR